MTHDSAIAPTLPGTEPAPLTTAYRHRRWLPEQVLFTPAALEEPWGQQILERVQAHDLPVEFLKQNRLSGLRGENERETYAIAKRTLAVVTAPAGQLKLTPIPPGSSTGSFTWPRAARPTASTATWRGVCRGRP